MSKGRAMLRAALVAVPLATAVAADPSAVGDWVTEGGKARVRIGPCGGDPAKLCGAITWSYQPEGAGPGPLVDANNQDPALRSRPIVGLPLLQGFEPDGPSAWSGGTIYDPEGGKTYRSKMRLDGPDRLEVEGCVLFVCRGQTWTRYRG